MIRLLTILLLLHSNIFATDKIQTILVTTPVLYALDEGGVKFAKIPYTGWDIDNPFNSCAFYSSPRVVFENQEHLKQDINLISAYKITVDSNHHDGITHITVRTQKAIKPDGFPLTVEKIVELTVKAVRADFPDEEKYLIKVSDKPLKPTAEQDAESKPRN